MSQQNLSANPEFLLHYERLRRDRARLRRQGYVLLVVAGGLLAGAILIGSTVHPGGTPGFDPQVLSIGFAGFALLLTWNGLVALRRARQPISDDEIARRRQEERRQLFQFAQGHISWRYWLAVAIQAFIGAIFLFLGILGAWSLVTNPNSLELLDMVLSFAYVLVGWYSLSRAIRRARLLRRLAAFSGQELADHLSLGEATEGE